MQITLSKASADSLIGLLANIGEASLKKSSLAGVFAQLESGNPDWFKRRVDTRWPDLAREAKFGKRKPRA